MMTSSGTGSPSIANVVASLVVFLCTSGISLDSLFTKTFRVASLATFFLCYSIDMASTNTMMPTSIYMTSFPSRCLSILAFLLEFARDCLVVLARETTYFLLMMGEVGLGAG